MSGGCPFCEGTGGAEIWRSALLRVVQVDEAGYPGFCRVVWNTHVAEVSDLDAAARTHLFDVLVRVEREMRTVMRCDKVNLASLGNQVPHLHWHVIPRYRDDSHFPQSVWSVPSRTVAPETLVARQALATRLGAALAAALASDIAR